ncbi:MAG: DUF4296 domain-containing protein [Prevotella sp.]|nr:DUF4296 domain-containing protein [Prevotella sp.]
MVRAKGLTVILVAVAILAACKPTTPSGVIGEGDMEDLLYDYHVSRAMASQTATSTEYVDFNQEVYLLATLKKHGYTKADFDSSLVYYYGRADKFSKIYSRVTQRLNDKAASLGAAMGELNQYSTLSASGDTANIWRDATALLLMPRPCYNRAEFTLKADTSFRKGDSFQMNLLTNFMFKGGTRDATFYVAVRYDNDSVSAHSTRCTSTGVSTLRIPASRDHVVKDLRLFFYLAPSTEAASSSDVMFINQIQFIRFHSKEAPVSTPAPVASDSLKVQRDTTANVQQTAPVQNRPSAPVQNNPPSAEKPQRVPVKPVTR